MTEIGRHRILSAVPAKAAARLASVGALMLGLLVVHVGMAEAKSRTCVRLERQLASLSSGKRAANPSKVRTYDRAIRRQKEQINRATRRLRRAGCEAKQDRSLFGGALSCRRIKRSLREMQANLRQLRAQRKRFSSGRGSNTKQRRRIKRALAANRCNEVRQLNASRRNGVLVERSRQRRSLIDQIFGEERTNNRRRNRRYDDYDAPDYPDERRPVRGSTYRTLCVRTCDGYYFPISFSTTPGNFERDAGICSAKCPGTNTELYYHPTSQESEAMISYHSEEPYTALETAFNYRKSVTPGCGCKFPTGGMSEIAGAGGLSDPLAESRKPQIATPTYRFDRAEDPDTLINRLGSFIPEPVSRQVARKESPANGGKRKVRIVGEAFFPVQ